MTNTDTELFHTFGWIQNLKHSNTKKTTVQKQEPRQY